MQAVFENISTVFSTSDNHSDPHLDPQRQYLRASAGGPPEFLVLGFIDPHPQGPIEVWYSASGEVLRIQNGRIVAAVGLHPLEWRKVTLSAQPRWSNITTSLQIQRQRDMMPGYQFSITDSLSISPISPRKKSNLVGIDPASLHWYQEVSTEGPALPVSRYAVRQQNQQETVIYSEQCLSEDLCIYWQRWPATSE